MKPIVMTTPSFFSVTFVEEGRPILVMSNDERYNKCLELYKNAQFTELRDFLCPDKAIEQISNGDLVLDIEEGIVTYQGQQVHNVVCGRIFEAVKGNLPYDHLLAFLNCTLDGMSDVVLNELFLFLESNETMPIMEDGSFIAYRVVDHNYMSKHPNPDGSYNRNMIGDKPEMKRNQVDSNRQHTCSSGLHFCSFSYIPHYGYAGSDRVMIVKIFPQDVISIPNDYNNSKGRCCKYEVIGEVHDYKNTKQFYNRAQKIANETAYNEPSIKEETDEYDVVGEVKKHLNKLIEPYRTQALNNLDEDRIKKSWVNMGKYPIDSIEDAIDVAFQWDETPEGEDYWYDVFNMDAEEKLVGEELEEDEDDDEYELSPIEQTVKNIIDSQLERCGSTTARNVAKSTKPYVNCQEVVEIAIDLGYKTDSNEVVSKTLIRK